MWHMYISYIYIDALPCDFEIDSDAFWQIDIMYTYTYTLMLCHTISKFILMLLAEWHIIHMYMYILMPCHIILKMHLWSPVACCHPVLKARRMELTWNRIRKWDCGKTIVRSCMLQAPYRTFDHNSRAEYWALPSRNVPNGSLASTQFASQKLTTAISSSTLKSAKLCFL